MRGGLRVWRRHYRKPFFGVILLSFNHAEGVTHYYIFFGRVGIISGGMDAACYNKFGAKYFCYN
jgi:hypothetical protein